MTLSGAESKTALCGRLPATNKIYIIGNTSGNGGRQSETGPEKFKDTCFIGTGPKVFINKFPALHHPPPPEFTTCTVSRRERRRPRDVRYHRRTCSPTLGQRYQLEIMRFFVTLSRRHVPFRQYVKWIVQPIDKNRKETGKGPLNRSLQDEIL